MYTAPGGFPRFWRLLRGLPVKAQFWLMVQDQMGGQARKAEVVRGPLGPGEFTPIESLAEGWMGHIA